jgi:hypothetical protein
VTLANPRSTRDAVGDALEILRETLRDEARVVTEDRSSELVEKIRADFAH